MNTNINRATRTLHLGLIDYKEAWDYQTELFNQILAVKSGNRNADPALQKPTSNFLLFCEHPNVYTLGRNGEEKNLLIAKEELGTINASYYHTNRGGDITWHGPGQIVVYPVIDLENFFTDIHQYMRLLEESVIQTVSEYGIHAGRIAGLTGVWCGADDDSSARKIAALGVKTSRWVTMHGLALNVNPDLGYFGNIIACGIQDKAVTSIAKETDKFQDQEIVSAILEKKLRELFRMTNVKNVLDTGFSPERIL